jgi:hypothetical protein
MATKATIQPSFLKQEEPEVVAEEIPAFVNIINKASVDLLLESGRVKPNDEGVATRAEYQNLSYVMERVV